MNGGDAKKLAAYRAQIDREIGLQGTLYDFVKMAWPIAEAGKDFQDNWHIGAMCEHLQALNAFEIQKLVINIPPGCMKSRLTGLFWPVWSWIQDGGSTRWGFWSFDQALVYREAGDTLELIRSPWFKQRWGDRVVIKDRAPAVGEYWTKTRGLRFSSTTPKGDATGWHFRYRVVDDPHKPQTISKVTLDESRRWWYGTLPTRADDPATVRDLVVMQRLHELDVAALAEQDGFVVLRIPMRYERKSVCVTPVGFNDPRTEEGELLWVNRFPEHVVKSLEKKLGPVQTAGQLQQRPVPEGGAIYRRDWFRTWVRPGQPTEHIAAQDSALGGSGRWKELPEHFDEVIQSWDCAFKGAEDSDFVCGQVWGRKDEDFYLLDEVCERMGFHQTCEAIESMSKRWPHARPIIVEDKANGPAVIETMKEKLSGIEEVPPEGGKHSRAHSTTGTYHAGCVYHPDPMFHPWVEKHRKELLAFPYGANDDRVDAGSQALIFMLKRFRAFTDAMVKFAKVIVPGETDEAATKEEVKDVNEMLTMLYGLQRVL